MLVQICRCRSQTAGTGGLRCTFRCERKVLDLERRVRLKTDHVATIAQVKERASARAHRASLQTVLVEIHWAEVLAVAAVLPLYLDGSLGLTFEVNLSEQVAAIFTLDGTLARSEKSSFVFRAEYSHFRSSLQRRVTVQVVFRTKHVMAVGGTDLRLTDEKSGREVCGYAHRLRSSGKFCNNHMSRKRLKRNKW